MMTPTEVPSPQRYTAASVGVAGPNTWNVIANVQAAVGIAGNLSRQARTQIHAAQTTSAGSTYLGDRAAMAAIRRGMWFSDWTYLVCSTRSRMPGAARVRWREGRDVVFNRQTRQMPVGIDCGSYRRLLGNSGTLPTWTHEFERYQEAIALIDPDVYAAWDDPRDRAVSLRDLRTLMRVFPHDVDNGRMWPVFSVRWTWNDHAIARFNRLPGWASRDLSTLIPMNRTQRQYSAVQLATWARAAIANALVLAGDPDFRWMVERFGRIMLGGMVDGPVHRVARHVFVATLCRLFPDTHVWLLGQANFATVNGLGAMGLLDRVWVDGSWYLQDARCARFAYVEQGLITMLNLGAGKQADGTPLIQPFFTLQEMMAANLRSLLAAYEGLWAWPAITPLPIDVRDDEQLVALRSHYRESAQELRALSGLQRVVWH